MASELVRGATVGGWEVQRKVGERPWPEVKAERADGTQARLLVIPWPPSAPAPAAETIAAWRAGLAPAWLDHPAFPALRGVGHDAAAGAVWIARAWTPWNSLAAVIDGTTALPVGRRGAALLALGEALAVLHRGGAVHGALAPGRVLLSRADGSACELLDLGVRAVAAALGARVPGALRPPEDEASAAGDVHAFAAIVEAMLVTGGPGRWTWSGRLAAWCLGVASSPAADRPRIDEAIAALRAILPEPEAPEAPPPPIAPPSKKELEIIERMQRERDEQTRARNEALRREREPPPPPAVVDVNAPFVPPIVTGGPGIERDAWPGLIRARRPSAVVTETDPGTIHTGPVTWYLGFGQRVDAAAAIADAIALAIDALGGKLGGSTLDDELRSATFVAVDTWPSALSRWKRDEHPPRGTRWWHRPGIRVVIAGDATTVEQEMQGWVSSHETGTIGHAVIRLASGGEPKRGTDRTRLLASMLAVLARYDDRPSVSYVCRLCRRGFAGLHFHSDLGACHRCSETYLHVIH